MGSLLLRNRTDVDSNLQPSGISNSVISTLGTNCSWYRPGRVLRRCLPFRPPEENPGNERRQDLSVVEGVVGEVEQAVGEVVEPAEEQGERANEAAATVILIPLPERVHPLPEPSTVRATGFLKTSTVWLRASSLQASTVRATGVLKASTVRATGVRQTSKSPPPQSSNTSMSLPKAAETSTVNMRPPSSSASTVRATGIP